MHLCKCYALNAIHQFQKEMCVLITKMWKEEFTVSKDIFGFANAIQVDHLTNEELKTLEEILKDFK